MHPKRLHVTRDQITDKEDLQDVMSQMGVIEEFERRQVNLDLKVFALSLQKQSESILNDSSTTS